MAFEVDARDCDEVRVLSLVGDLDERGTKLLDQKLREADANGVRSLLIDCGRLDSLTGGGLRLLITVRQRLLAESGGLILCALKPEVRRVLDVARISDSFSVQKGRKEALKVLREQVRMRRVSRLVEKLLRRKREARPEVRVHRPPDTERASLAVQLLSEASPELASKEEDL